MFGTGDTPFMWQHVAAFRTDTLLRSGAVSSASSAAALATSLSPTLSASLTLALSTAWSLSPTAALTLTSTPSASLSGLFPVGYVHKRALCFLPFFKFSYLPADVFECPFETNRFGSKVLQFIFPG